jgi:hypothetical protein
VWRPSEIGDTTRHTLVCVDGKQRLSSVKAFIKGIIPCNDHRGQKWWFAISHDTPAGRKKNVLSEKDQKAFLSKEFVTFEYAGLSQAQEEDLFARVQMGVQLTLAEKMRASTGPWQELARCYVEDYPVICSLLKDRARAKDFQMTLSCFSQILEVQHPTVANGIPTLRTNHTHLPKLLENTGAVDDGIKSHLASVWNTFQTLIDLDPNTFTNTDKHLRGVQTFAPVEMVAVVILISMYSESRNNNLLIGDIRALRVALRENFIDLRLNVQIWKFVWEFIKNLEQSRGAVDGTTVNRSVQVMPASAPKAAAPPGPTSPPLKRGQPTARTKPEKVLPGSRHAEAKPVAVTPPTDPRPRKRSRVDTEPTSIPSRSSMLSPADTMDTSRTLSATLDGTGHEAEGSSAFVRPGISANALHSPYPSNLAGTPQEQPVDLGEIAVPKSPTVPSSVPQRSQTKSLRQARQDHIAQLRLKIREAEEQVQAAQKAKMDPNNSYRAPVAPMGVPPVGQVPAPTAPTETVQSPSMPTTIDGNSSLWAHPTHNTPAAQATTQATQPPIFQPVLLPFHSSSGSARHTSSSHKVIHNASPTLPSAPPPTRAFQFNGRPSQIQHQPLPQQPGPIPPQVRPIATPTLKPTPDPRPKRPAKPFVHIDGAIDLTSDDEQEGQNLLALFGARASLEKSTGSKTANFRTSNAQPATTAAPRSRNHSRKRSSAGILQALAEKEPVQYNNPYERLKPHAGASRS